MQTRLNSCIVVTILDARETSSVPISVPATRIDILQRAPIYNARMPSRQHQSPTTARLLRPHQRVGVPSPRRLLSRLKMPTTKTLKPNTTPPLWLPGRLPRHHPVTTQDNLRPTDIPANWTRGRILTLAMVLNIITPSPRSMRIITPQCRRPPRFQSAASAMIARILPGPCLVELIHINSNNSRQCSLRQQHHLTHSERIIPRTMRHPPPTIINRQRLTIRCRRCLPLASVLDTMSRTMIAETSSHPQ
jgi:hypothetical protein